MNSKKEEKLKELNIEDFLSVIFIVLGILSIYGDYIQREYIKTNDYHYQEEADKLFGFILLISLIIYFIYLYRNYRAYKESSPEQKKLFSIKVLATCFLIAGALCSIYFQVNNKKFIGPPAI